MKKRYSVYDSKTDLPVCIAGTAKEAAAAAGMTVSSFYTILSKQRAGHKCSHRWEIFTDDEVDLDEEL